MRSFATISGLAALTFSLLAHATQGYSSHPARLSPIKLSDWEAATGIHRRASDEYSHLKPNDKARLLFGRPSSESISETIHLKLLICHREWKITCRRHESSRPKRLKHCYDGKVRGSYKKRGLQR